MSTSEPPPWPHCAQDADPAAPVGCRGIHVPGHTTCIAHLTDTDRLAYLTGLAPGDDIDHRGTTFTQTLLGELLDALRDPLTSDPLIGHARFDSATFVEPAHFNGAIFTGDARFASAAFTGDAFFGSVSFIGNAGFGSVTFGGDALFGSATFTESAGFSSAAFTGFAFFDSATFTRDARFSSAIFTGDAFFVSATFTGAARFGSATFTGDAHFNDSTFDGSARFHSAAFQGASKFGASTFTRQARFDRAIFNGKAEFHAASFIQEGHFEFAAFGREAHFDRAFFGGNAEFHTAVFSKGAYFASATFEGDAWFGSATFKGDARFGSAIFKGSARFGSATFEKADLFGPLVCAGQIVLSGAIFGGPVTMSFAARHLECRRTRWAATAEIRLRYATVNFAHAVFEYPLTIAAESDQFVLDDNSELEETALPSPAGPGVRLSSLRGVDAAHLVLADVDLSQCLFTGTVHLDQLRLEGACTFDTTPTSDSWWPVRLTERRVLAEEHHWRASQPGAVRGWNVAVLGAGRAGPLQLAPVYRALRKAFEDGKHEPGAADFYYGEMEMRRHADDIPRSERGLLFAYWALSGYGLRASRALAWLGAAMLLTIVLLMAFGLAKDTPKQTATGTVPTGGGKVTFEIDKDDPQNPTGHRFTGERFEKALNVTLNSVVFRSSGQDLTTAGSYIEMTSRLTEPVLLGLAVLAVRNRVKR
ncbi:pentapeptide repeat-containing protein [Streptomyces sp. 43Y-GA-1]|uniref:pentapeptide repeat-containing protein n=1 Tax=Streptomyces sp. 43Y-GA-1 TaxID=2939435 RepID=UPI0020BF691A|nr:pentapeptide repeat-containing protein [Streptomyces sp. 43Y-GA-1]MCL6293182.1 pentapeptide repeat-containing protein [Streptomyces sp. 43Y-GA-1]